MHRINITVIGLRAYGLYVYVCITLVCGGDDGDDDVDAIMLLA